MAKYATEQEGDRELDEEKQKLTTVAVDMVVWPESFCGGRNRRRRAAVPAMKTTRMASAALLLVFN